MVLKATDKSDNDSPVVLKLIMDITKLRKELDTRTKLDLDPDCVVPVICHSESPELAEKWQKDLIKMTKWREYKVRRNVAGHARARM